MPRVTGLGHVGIYVRDLERMVAFYRDVLGMQITKQNWRAGVVFLSADPDNVDHEIALMRGRPDRRSAAHPADLHARAPASTTCACSAAAPGGRGLPHRGRGQPRQRHRLLLLRSRGQPHRGVLGDRPALLGPDREPDRHRAARRGRAGRGRPRVERASPRARWAGGWTDETATVEVQLSNRALAPSTRKESAMATDASIAVLPGSERAQRWRRCFPCRPGRRASRCSIGLLTVKTGPLAAGGIQMEQGIDALPQGPELHAGRPQGRSSWWATRAATRRAPRPRPRSWSSATTST